MVNAANNQEPKNGNSTPIQRFFANSNIFITGGTGFLGVLLLEKLLYSCPTISTIYLLVRNKKRKDVQTRLDELFDDVIFSRMRQQHPNFREKIVPVEGDCEVSDLGLDLQDKAMLIREVNVVFHVAATVRFDEVLKKASFINVRAVRDIMQLAQQMPNLKSFVHVSTAFSNCIHQSIKERIYPPSMDYRRLLAVTEALPDDILNSITSMVVGKYPNTYSFTKQIGENVVKEEGKGLPVGIHRPSIVISTYKEPVRGWINNYYGPTGYMSAGAIGLVRAASIDPDLSANLVPADMVINSIIAAAWDIAENFSKNTSDVPVYNFEASQAPRLTWNNYISTCIHHNEKYFPTQSMWYVFYIPCKSPIYYKMVAFFLHTIPALLVDGVRICLRKPPMLLKVYQKIEKIVGALNFFTKTEWTFQSDNLTRLKNRMSDEDRKIFFCDIRGFDWDDYFDYYVKGTRIYMFKDPLETIPEGLKRFRRLYWLHQFTKSVIAVFLLWILWSIFSLIFKFIPDL